MVKYVNEQSGDIESPAGNEIVTHLGHIPTGTSVLVDVYEPGYPDDPKFLRRHNVPKSSLNASEKPIMFWMDPIQKKFRFWYSIEIFGGADCSFTLRRRPSPLRVKIANEGQNYTLASARTVWFGFRGRSERYHWQTVSTRWYGENCYQALIPHGNNEQLQCLFKNEPAGVQGTCSTTYFGSNPSQSRISHFCWIDLTGYTFYELVNVTNGGNFQGIHELLVDGRQLY